MAPMRKRPPLHNSRPIRLPELTPAGRWAVRFWLVCPILVFLLAAGFYSVHLFRLLQANLSPIAAAQISLQTKHQARIGALHLLPLGVVSMTDVSLSSRSTFARSHGQALVSAKRVIIHYNPAQLLFDSKDAAHAIGDIIVDQPHVLVVRLSKTQFNFSNIIKPPAQPATKPFVGQVVIQDGLLYFRDHLAPAGLGVHPALNTLAHVYALVNMHSERTVYFAANGLGTQGRFNALGVKGEASRLVAGRFQASIHASNLDAAYWAAYFAASPKAHVTQGRADLDLTVARLGSKPPPGLPIDLLGKIAVRGAAVQLMTPLVRKLSIREVTGSAVFTGTGLAFNAAAFVSGSKVQADGSVFNFAHPRIAAAASSPAIDLAAIARAIPGIHWPQGMQTGPVAATVNAVGYAAQPTVSGRASMPFLHYAGNDLANMQSDFVLSGQKLDIPALTLQTPGGGVASLHGILILKKGHLPQLRLAGRAVGVNLAALRLPQASKITFGGRADADFLADSIGQPLRVVADVAVAHPRVSRTQLLSARARLVYRSGQDLTVSRVLVRAQQGAALAAGKIPLGKTGAWSVSLDAAGFNLASLIGPYAHSPVSGLAYFQGRVDGAASQPHLVGRVQLLNPRYGRFAADVVRGGVTASALGVGFQNLTLDRFPASASVTGLVSSLHSADPRLHLAVHISQADLQDLVQIAQQVGPQPSGVMTHSLAAMTGTAGGTFQIAGSLHHPLLSGTATVTDATVGPYRVRSLQVQASYGSGVVRVAQATLKGEGAVLSAHGLVSLKTGHIQAAFTAQNINLEHLRVLTEPITDVDGIVGGTGTIGGFLKSPTVAATVTADGLEVNSQSLAPLTLSGRYAHGTFTKTGLPWVIDFLPPSPTGRSIRYVINTLSLSLPAPQNPAQPPVIALTADVPADSPETIPHLIQTIGESRFAAVPSVAALLSKIDTLPQPLGGTLAVPYLSVLGPLKAPAIHVVLNGQALTVGSSQLGGLTADVRFSDPKDPSASVDFSASGLLADGVSITHVTAKAMLAHHFLTLKDLRATSQSAYLDVSGTADLHPNGQVNANLDASNIPLALLDPLVPQPADARRSLTGEIGSLTVSMTGPTSAPDLATSINLTHPGLALGPPGGPAQVAYALQAIRSGVITLTSPIPGGAQVLKVTDLSAFQGGRPIAALSGTLPFRWHNQTSFLPVMPNGQPLHAQLVVQDLSLLAPFVPLLDPKRTTGTLTASLDVVNHGGIGLISGALDLTGGSVGLTGFDTGLQKVQAHLALMGNHITVGQFTGVSSKGGSVQITGGPGLTLGHADLAIVASKFMIDESSRKTLLAAKFGSSFRGQINGRVSINGPWLKPMLSTTANAPLQVSDASATIPSAPPASGSAAAAPAFDPHFHLTALLGSPRKTISVGNALLHANADGNVELTGKLSSPNLKAHLDIARGQFYLPPATRLQFIRAPEGNVVDIAYPKPSPDGSGQPSLRTDVDLTAQTNVSLSPSELAASQSLMPTGTMGEAPPALGTTQFNAASFNQPQTYTITAHIIGVLSSPHLQIHLTSSPSGLSHAQMLSALTGVAGLQQLAGANAQSAFQQELTSAFYQVGVPTLLTPLEENIAQSLNLSEFNVAYEPDSAVTVTLSKMLAPRIELTYLRSIGPRSNQTNTLIEPPQYTIKLSYSLTHRLQVSISTDDQNNNTIALEGVSGF